MPTNYHEEITKLLDSAGLIDKTPGDIAMVSVYEKVRINGSSGYKLRGKDMRGYLTHEEGIFKINDFNRVRVENRLDDNSFDFDMMEYGELTYVLGSFVRADWDLREVMAYLHVKSRCGRFYSYLGDGVIQIQYMTGKGEHLEKVLQLDMRKPLSQQDLKPLYELMKSISDNK